MNTLRNVKDDNVLVKAFVGVRSCIDTLENKSIEKRNAKGLMTKFDTISYMKMITSAKSMKDIVSIEDYLEDRKYKGLIELPSFGLNFMEALVLYKAITREGRVIIKTKHKGIEVYQNVKLKAVGRGSKMRVIIDSDKVIDYRKIECACIEL